jgi:hypothetical protein
MGSAGDAPGAQPRPLEDFQMLGDAVERDGEVGGDLQYDQLALGQVGQDGAPGSLSGIWSGASLESHESWGGASCDTLA